MNITLLFIIVAIIIIFIILYRSNTGAQAYQFVSRQGNRLYSKVAPYTYKEIRKKIKELKQDYTLQQYIGQVILFALGGGIITYLYFYNLVISIIYAVIAVAAVPYLSYLRCKRLYSEFIFEQIQVYTTNVIMEFATTQSFVKALEGVHSSGILEDPVKSDVKTMIDMAYENGTINQSLEYMNEKYDYYIVRNMHQLFLQITNEGSKDSSESLENMSQDIDMLVESVYRDRIDREAFYKKFVTFGLVLYMMIALVQIMLGDTYQQMLELWYVNVILHLIVIVNTYFLLAGTKFYNENVGAE
ncbi:MAG: hypothetical protein E7174_01430 [Firmicutes bacterium]|nr:hypothetical protein [Bacillota bacterium]